MDSDKKSSSYLISDQRPSRDEGTIFQSTYDSLMESRKHSHESRSSTRNRKYSDPFTGVKNPPSNLPRKISLEFDYIQARSVGYSGSTNLNKWRDTEYRYEDEAEKFLPTYRTSASAEFSQKPRQVASREYRSADYPAMVHGSASGIGQVRGRRIRLKSLPDASSELILDSSSLEKDIRYNSGSLFTRK